MNKHIAAATIITLQTLVLSAIALPPSLAAEPVATQRNEVAQGRGTVVRVDLTAGVASISHEAIPALKWPAMTMDFKVADKKMLAGLKPGQAIVFALTHNPATGYVISRIEAAK